MGDIEHRLVRVPNSEAWIDKHAVVAVARMDDTEVWQGKDSKTPIKMVNFQIRLSDGKTVNFQHQDRKSVSDFLSAIGVTWEG